MTRVEDAVAIAAYCQALVKQLCERYEAGEEIPTYHRILTSENKWLAARYGLDAPVMDLATGRRNRVPIAKLVRRTLRELEPHARELGSERELEGDRGDPRPRQLAPSASCASSTRTATSSRWSARSRTRPRRCRSPPRARALRSHAVYALSFTVPEETMGGLAATSGRFSRSRSAATRVDSAVPASSSQP